MASEQRRLSTLLGHLKATPDKASGYRYSLDTSCSGVLSREQRQHYEDNGFLVVEGLVPQHKLDVYRDRFRQICAATRPLSSDAPRVQVGRGGRQVAEPSSSLARHGDSQGDGRYAKRPITSCSNTQSDSTSAGRN